jgi:hypothetical protein
MFYNDFGSFKTRAFQLADLVNSSFIDNVELNNIANDVWRQVYSDLIFIGDKFFLKTQNIKSKETRLNNLDNDETFFSLEGIYGVRNDIVTPFMRRSGTQKLSGNLYDIIGMSLYVYNTENFDYIEMRYFPMPEKLFVPDEHSKTVVTGSVMTDMPNNIFTQYLCYKVAIQLKVKQGADATGLSALANDMWETYLQTLNRDNFGMVRIQNVYNNRGWR